MDSLLLKEVDWVNSGKEYSEMVRMIRLFSPLLAIAMILSLVGAVSPRIAMANQENSAILKLTVFLVPERDVFSTGEQFALAFQVENITQVDADDVLVGIDLPDTIRWLSGGDDTPDAHYHNIGTLSPGPAKAQGGSWNLKCLGAGFNAEINVSALIDGQVADVNVTQKVDQVNKAELDVMTMISPEPPFCVGGDFKVEATVTNIAVKPAASADDVSVALALPSSVEFDPNVPDQGDFLVGNLGAGESSTVEWSLRCKDAQLNDEITVNTRGQDAVSGKRVTDSEVINIDQKHPGELGVEVVTNRESPFCTDQVFMVTATVSNVGQDPAADTGGVKATINLPSSVMLDPDIAEQNLEISLDAIAPGESKIAEWQLVCVAVGTGEELSVTAIGSNGCEGETSATDSVLVDQ
ncbi:MAG: hypothetical protein SVY53_08160, partial [Chloroflexota bacterium]|nr:hypothetical protein [Chloroflexota bacterium]